MIKGNAEITGSIGLKSLKSAMKKLSYVIEARPTNAYNSNVFVNRQCFFGTDNSNELKINHEISFKKVNIEEVNFNFNFKAAYKFIMKIKRSEVIDIRFDGEDVFFSGTSGSISLPSLPTINPNSLESVIDTEKDYPVALKYGEPFSKIHQVSFASGKAESRPYLCGVLFNNKGSSHGSALVASDGEILAFNNNVSYPESLSGATMTNKAITIHNALGSEAISCTANDYVLSIEYSNYRLTSKRMQGGFPRWETVVPDSPLKNFRVKASELLNALDMIDQKRSIRSPQVVSIDPVGNELSVESSGYAGKENFKFHSKINAEEIYPYNELFSEKGYSRKINMKLWQIKSICTAFEGEEIIVSHQAPSDLNDIDLRVRRVAIQGCNSDLSVVVAPLRG